MADLMSKIYATALAGKEIVTVEGTVLGELENIVLDLKTGALVDMVVKPDSNLHDRRYRAAGKFVLVPFGAVRAVKDFILVDEGRAGAESPWAEVGGEAGDGGDGGD